MPNKTTSHGAAELARASDHLSYEIKMFFSMSSVRLRDPKGLQAIVNAVLESFVIHFRVLCDFFYPQHPRAEDVLADHFFDSPSDWRRPKLSKYLRDSRTRAHKEVAHLTYDRLKVTPDEKEWDRAKLSREMLPVIREFLKTVPDARIGPKCKAMRDQVLASKSAASLPRPSAI